ncbi:acyl carrier protein [Streptomyces sp. NPDC005438]|uniref:acyl carrier protein n=1 Tax=Streptomyces sp. NPDC005438 TaxID=3156880 RepID=UPI0033B8F5FF
MVGLWRALASEEPVVRLVDPSRVGEPATPEKDEEALGECGGPPTTPEPVGVDGPPADDDTGNGESVGEQPELRSVLAGLPRSQWPEAVLNGVRTLAAAVLGYDSAEALDAEEEFFDLGLTSVTALELRDHLTTLTGVEWPADVLYDCPTPSALTELVVERLASEAA